MQLEDFEVSIVASGALPGIYSLIDHVAGVAPVFC